MQAIATVIKTVSIVLCIFWLAGCVQNKTIPGYAKSGDYIVLGLGGIHRNSLSATTLTPDDLTITITDKNFAVFPIKASNVFKAYPDYSSYMNAWVEDGTLDPMAIIPYDGGWFAVVALRDINTDAPLALEPGPASVAITSPKLSNTTLQTEGDLTDIPIEILSGTSTKDLQYLQQFGAYAPHPENFVISPSNLSGINDVGGAYFVINYSDDTFFKSGIEPVVIPSNHNPFVQLSYNVKPNGDGTGVVYVTLLNPAGFKTVATATSNSSMLDDLTVKLQYFGLGDAAQAKTVFSLDLASSYYIDIDGNVIAGLQPSMTHSIDL